MLLPILLVLLVGSPAVAPGNDELPDDLSQDHRDWLELVTDLITEEERAYFLALEENYQREAFIEKFWEVRDPDQRTRLNELRILWEEWSEQARLEFGDFEDDRALALLTNGPPGGFVLPDGRVVSKCFHKSKHIEIWFYGQSARTERRFVLIFIRRTNRVPYELWLPGLRLDGAGRGGLPTTEISKLCSDDLFDFAMAVIRNDSQYESFVLDLLEPEPPPAEWVSTFASFTTDLPDDAETLSVELRFEFPGRKQSRTAVQGILQLPRSELGRIGDGEDPDVPPLHELLLTGEVVRDDALFESFRYRYELEATEEEGTIPVVFQRYLRPGTVRIILKLEDLLTRRVVRLAEMIEVPSSDQLISNWTESESEFLKIYAEANEASSEAADIRILPPLGGGIRVGGTRFATQVSGPIDKVTFFLNDKPILTKRRPPYSVELNLGSVAASHVLRVEAYGDEGAVVAADELMVNQGGQRFRVRLVEPRSDRTYSQSLMAIANVQVPQGAALEKVEIFLSERRLATLYQEPFELPILLDRGGLAYVRAVAYLEDGNSTEDVVFINAPDVLEEVEVQYVELYASVVDGNGRPVLGLESGNFTVLEDGVRQSVRRFEWVESLPIHAGLLLDTSASMEDSLERVTEAALAFVEETIQPKDRIALLSFASQPRVELGFTNSTAEVEQGLSLLKAEGGTALYDSLVFALHYFHGMRGQKALLILSDGKDESSRFDFEASLEIARRAGVTVYAIALKEAAKDKGSRRVLRQYAQETGGQAYFVDDLSELPRIYATIQTELRSQYLLAYQSTSEKDPSEFRTIEVKLGGADGEVRTMSGYYP